MARKLRHQGLGFEQVDNAFVRLANPQQTQALSCNLRYLEALAAVDDPTPTYDYLRTLTERHREKGRSSAGFNPAREEEARLFAAVLAGDHIAQGFRNKDIRQALHADDPKVRQRLSAAVGRLLKRLHVRRLVAKVPRTRRWRVTEQGRRILSDTLRFACIADIPPKSHNARALLRQKLLRKCRRSCAVRY